MVNVAERFAQHKAKLKSKIKNDLWRINYIVPFVKKHQLDGKGKLDLARHVITAYSQISVVKSMHRMIGFDTKRLLEEV